MTEINATQGVYYNSQDYAGFLRRIIIACTDFVALIVFWIILAVAWMYLHPEQDFVPPASFWVVLISAFLYLTIIKRSFGTLGYLIAGVRIVDIHGNRPSVIRMIGRFMWLFILPFSSILDILWLTGEETRQTLRDKTVGTYVVKKKANPLGTGKCEIKVMSFMGLCLRLREVEKDSQDSDPNSDKS
jgi:uncharacterized RDD family membrane protein YckC